MQSQRKARPLNTRFIVRGLIVALVLLIVALVAISLLPPQLLGGVLVAWQANQPPEPTPLPPTITAPRGALPAGPVGLQEQRRHQGGQYEPVGSGFLLQLDGGPVVGVTTAHSLIDLGVPLLKLDGVAFAVSGASPCVEFDTLFGAPGVAFSSQDFSVDYVLLKLPAAAPAIDPALVLHPDPRGGPQLGERIMLFSGLGDGQGGPRALAGTVQLANATTVWALMDEQFEPGQMSGSPLLSQHTGQVVGMTVAAAVRRGHTLMGFHPIGSIVKHAQAAETFPKIVDYRR